MATARKKHKNDYRVAVPDHRVTLDDALDLSLCGVLGWTPDGKLADGAPKTQRATDMARVEKMVEDFVPSAAPPLCLARCIHTVVDADGTVRRCKYAIVDGGHRYATLIREGHTHFRAEIHHRLDVKGIAALSIIRNREAKSLTAIEQWQIGVTAQLPLYVATLDVLTRVSLQPITVAAYPGKNQIGAVGALTNSMELYGEAAVELAIDTLDLTYRRADPVQWDGAILQGMAKFFEANDELDPERVAERLAKSTLTSSAAIFRQEVITRTTTNKAGVATSGGSGSRYNTAARIVAEVYNKRVRTGLRAVA